MSLCDNKIEYAKLSSCNFAQLHYLHIFFSKGFYLETLYWAKA